MTPAGSEIQKPSKSSRNCSTSSRRAMPFTLEIRGRRFRVVSFELEPNIRMAKVRHPVDPKPHRPKLENTTFRFFLDQRQTERVAVKRDRLLIDCGLDI